MKLKREPFIRGKTVDLRPVEFSDVPLVAKWINDPDATQFMFTGQLPTSERQVRELVRGYIENPHHVVFIIVEKVTRQPVGFAGLFELYGMSSYAGKFLPGFIASWYSSTGSGDYRILIGEKKFWNKGYGAEVCALLTHYGFDRLNLNVMALGLTRADNRGAIQLYERLGYRFCGIKRRSMYRNGRYYDAALMDILREEYYKTYLHEYEQAFGVSSAVNFLFDKAGERELQKRVADIKRTYYGKRKN